MLGLGEGWAGTAVLAGAHKPRPGAGQLEFTVRLNGKRQD